MPDWCRVALRAGLAALGGLGLAQIAPLMMPLQRLLAWCVYSAASLLVDFSCTLADSSIRYENQTGVAAEIEVISACIGLPALGAVLAVWVDRRRSLRSRWCGGAALVAASWLFETTRISSLIVIAGTARSEESWHQQVFILHEVIWPGVTGLLLGICWIKLRAQEPVAREAEPQDTPAEVS